MHTSWLVITPSLTSQSSLNDGEDSNSAFSVVVTKTERKEFHTYTHAKNIIHIQSV